MSVSKSSAQKKSSPSSEPTSYFKSKRTAMERESSPSNFIGKIDKDQAEEEKVALNIHEEDIVVNIHPSKPFKMTSIDPEMLVSTIPVEPQQQKINTLNSTDLENLIVSFSTRDLRIKYLPFSMKDKFAAFSISVCKEKKTYVPKKSVSVDVKSNEKAINPKIVNLKSDYEGSEPKIVKKKIVQLEYAELEDVRIKTSDWAIAWFSQPIIEWENGTPILGERRYCWGLVDENFFNDFVESDDQGMCKTPGGLIASPELFEIAIKKSEFNYEWYDHLTKETGKKSKIADVFLPRQNAKGIPKKLFVAKIFCYFDEEKKRPIQYNLVPSLLSDDSHAVRMVAWNENKKIEKKMNISEKSL